VSPEEGLTKAWRAAEAACPAEWQVVGVVRGPREAVELMATPDWVAWARGPHGGERVEGQGASPEAALRDLAERLRTLA
jgi:hypothetical protein